MELIREPWASYKGQQTELITMRDPTTGFEVQVSDYGATLVRVKSPDKDGNIDDINFGQDSPDEYVKQGGHLGATTGRVANRIGNARFELDGQEYSLFVNNNNVHSLHGGKEGFNVKFWEVIEAEATEQEARVQLRYISPDMEEGYPGTLTTLCTYIVKPMQLSWIYEAETDKPTIVNLTNHAYWNLDGLDTTIDNLELQLNAEKYMPGDHTLIPTGEVKSVEGTGLDLRTAKSFSTIFDEHGEIDNNFFIKDAIGEKLVLAAILHSPNTGRKMRVLTTEPCVQVYTGNFMGDLKSFGKQCQAHSGVCLETQRVPNAINFPEFRESVILRPGDRYFHHTIHEFAV